jgi:integrating conjugative element protein (TIGR03759 family)
MKKAAVPWMTLLLFFPMLGSWAVETGRTTANNVTTQDSQANSSEEVFSQGKRFTRSQWSLDETEWQRYLTLMQGIRGSISQPNLSPLEVLGIHAETDEERRGYAGRLAKVMHDDAERVLAFARVYQEEANKLNPNPALIDKALLGLGTVQKNSLQNGDRILYFTRIAHCPMCKHQLSALMKATQTVPVQLDIYVVDAKSDGAIRAWAGQQPLDSQRIKSKTLTLNHDRGTLTQMAGPASTAPITLLIRGQNVAVLDPSSLN